MSSSLWSLNKSQLGLITIVRTITQTVSAPFWGYAADRYSRKRIIIFGTGAWGLWTLVCGLLTNFGQLLVVRAIAGLGLPDAGYLFAVGRSLYTQPARDEAFIPLTPDVIIAIARALRNYS